MGNGSLLVREEVLLMVSIEATLLIMIAFATLIVTIIDITQKK